MNKVENSFLNKNQFGEDFLWGVSTAAFQIEGAHDADGKGLLSGTFLLLKKEK